MKSKLKETWLPKWFTLMPKNHHKEFGKWVAWSRPKPTKDPDTTNHQRHLAAKAARVRK